MVLVVEVALNNRLLRYIEDNVQISALTPTTFVFDQPNALRELETHSEQS